MPRSSTRASSRWELRTTTSSDLVDLEIEDVWSQYFDRDTAERMRLDRDSRCSSWVWEPQPGFCGQPGRRHIKDGTVEQLRGRAHHQGGAYGYVLCPEHEQALGFTIEHGWRPIEDVTLPG